MEAEVEAEVIRVERVTKEPHDNSQRNGRDRYSLGEHKSLSSFKTWEWYNMRHLKWCCVLIVRFPKLSLALTSSVTIPIQTKTPSQKSVYSSGYFSIQCGRKKLRGIPPPSGIPVVYSLSGCVSA